MKSPELPKLNNLETKPESEQEEEFLDMEYGELSPEEQKKMDIVNEQFDNPKFVEIPMPGNEKEIMKIEYVVLDARNENEINNNDRTVLNVAGFAASYRGPESFIKLLAVRENKRVINISMPNTGESDDMPTEFRKWSKDGRSFEQFVDVLNNSLDAIKETEAEDKKKTTDELSVIGMSKGALIATKMAIKYPDKVKDLVLIHPSGVNEENVFNLASRQGVETASDKKSLNKNPEINPKHKKELEEAYQETFGKSLQQAYEEAGGEGKFDLQDADTQAHDFYNQAADNITKDSRPNIKDNFLWHLWEAATIAKGGMLEMLPKVKANMYLIYGGDDKLFTKSQVKRIKEKIPKVDIDVFPSMNHNGPYKDARRYSSSIVTFLDKMREKE